MHNFQEKNSLKRFMRSKPVLILLSIILIVFIWNIFGLFNKMQNTYRNKKMEQEKIADLEKRKEKLLVDIQKLDTEKGKEEIIRENFGMVKEGEQLIVVVEDKTQKGTQKEPEFKGFFGFFKKIFR